MPFQAVQFQYFSFCKELDFSLAPCFLPQACSGEDDFPKYYLSFNTRFIFGIS